MRKGRFLRVLTIVALFVAISGLTIAFAAINDSFKNKEDVSIWNIQLQDIKVKNDGMAVFQLPIVSDTVLQNYSVELKKPGDAVHLSFKISNKGSLDAILSTLIEDYSHCKVENGDANICKKIKYTLQYEDGGTVSLNDLLNHNSEKKIQFSIIYPNDAPSVGDGRIVIDFINLIILYKQNV